MHNELQLIRWENPVTRRYYQAWVGTNLFVGWEVFIMWGGIDSKRGNSRVVPVASFEEATLYLENIAARRKKRHYFRVFHEA